MDREALRQELLANANQTRNSALWRFLNADQKLDCLASLQFWAENAPAANSALDRLLEIRNGISKRKELMPREEDKRALQSFLDIWNILLSCHSVSGALELLAALVVSALSD